jgi:hypothetical protein
MKKWQQQQYMCHMYAWKRNIFIQCSFIIKKHTGPALDRLYKPNYQQKTKRNYTKTLRCLSIDLHSQQTSNAVYTQGSAAG